MRITLIEPAPPGFHVYSFIKQVRLGLPLLATLLRDGGHDVRVLVEGLGELDWSRIMSSDLVGISSITSTAIKAYRYAQRVRDGGIDVVMGGPHVTFEADEALEFSDYVVRGEGEDAMLELTDYVEKGGDLGSIAGLSFHDDTGSHVHNDLRPLRSTLTDLPITDLSLVDNNDKISPIPILTSRGCPYDCEFCSVILMFGRKVRTVDPPRVIEDIRKAQPESIFFYDDNFFITKKRGRSMLAEMIRAGLNVPFSAQIRVDSISRRGKVDYELLGLMKEAGCRRVYMGLESVNPETLKAYNKKQDVDDISGGLKALNDYGIDTHGMFVFGSDSDTPQSMMETVDYALEHGITTAQFMILTPLPGTRQWDQFESEGRIFTKNWSLYDGHHVVFRPKRMTAWELQETALEAHQRFYSLKRAVGNGKFGFHGFLISHGWERVPENMAYLRELRELSAAYE